MYVDGAVKSLAKGVSTIDERRVPPGFAKKQVNFRSSAVTGCTRRSPFDYITTAVTEFNAETDIVRLGELKNGDTYYVFIRPRLYGVTEDWLSVFDKDGLPIVVERQNGAYIADVTGEQDVEILELGDLLMIANKNRTMELAPLTHRDEVDYVEESMIYLRRSTYVGELTIDISWNNNTTADLKTIVKKTASVTITADQRDSASVVATNIIAAMTAVADGYFSFKRINSTILMTPIGDPQAIVGYCNLQVSNVTDEDMIAINGTIYSEDHYPDGVLNGTMLKVQLDKQDSSSVYYLRARSEKDRVDGNGDGTVITPIELADIEMQTKNVDSGSTVARLAELGDPEWVDNSTTDITSVETRKREVFILPEPGVSLHTNIYSSLIIKGPGTGVISPDLIESVVIIDDLTGDQIISCTKEDFFDIDLTADWELSGDASEWVLTVKNKYEPGKQTIGNWGNGNPTIPTLSEDRKYSVYLNRPAISIPETIDGRLVLSENLVWLTSSGPDIQFKIDESTMPHILYELDDGTFKFGPASGDGQSLWADNRTNDKDPEFIGKTINALGTFQSRLCLLAGDRFVASSTSNLFRFFRGNAVQQLATDPISIGSTVARGSDFEFMIEHNRDLMIFGKEGQFKISGSVALTAATAAITRTAKYDYSRFCRPIASGSDIMYAYSYGESDGVQRYTVDDGRYGMDTANSITKHCDLLIGGTIRQLVAAPNFNILAGVSEFGNDIFVAEYDSDEDIYAWSTWTLPFNLKVAYLLIDSDRMIVFAEENEQLVVMSCELIASKLDSIYNRVHLDKKVLGTVINQEIEDIYDLPISTNPDELLEVVYLDGDYAGDTAPWDHVGTGITITEPVPDGTTVAVGYRYTSEYTPMKIRVRDEGGHLQSKANLRLTSYKLSLINTLKLDAAIVPTHATSPTTDYTAKWDGLVSGSINAVTDSLTHDDEAIFHIPVGIKSTEHQLNITTDSYFPATIASIEWQGKYIKRGRRF